VITERTSVRAGIGRPLTGGHLAASTSKLWHEHRFRSTGLDRQTQRMSSMLRVKLLTHWMLDEEEDWLACMAEL